MSKDARCDFCSTPKPVWGYPATDFSMVQLAGHTIAGSDGDWAACEVCYRLIEEGKRDELVLRSANLFYAYHFGNGIMSGPTDLKFLREQIRSSHDKFFAHRIGPAYKI